MTQQELSYEKEHLYAQGWVLVALIFIFLGYSMATWVGWLIFQVVGVSCLVLALKIELDAIRDLH